MHPDVDKAFAFSVAPEIVGDAREKVVDLIRNFLVPGYCINVNDEDESSTFLAIDDQGITVRGFDERKTGPKGPERRYVFCADEDETTRNLPELHSIHVY